MTNYAHSLAGRKSSLVPMWIPILVGIGMGLLAIYSFSLETKWVTIVLVASAAPVVALIVKDIRKLALVLLVVDLPLSFDIALNNQGTHQGGPTGYLISLMTIGLVIGYATWFAEKKPAVRFFPAVTVPALIYLGMVLLSFYQSRSVEFSLFGLFLGAQLFLYFFYIANHLDSWDQLRLVMVTLAILLLLESVYIVFQYTFNTSITFGFIPSVRDIGSAGVTGARVGGTVGSPNSAGEYLATSLLIVLGAYASGKLLNPKLALPALGFGLLALVITMTRAAWGNFAVGLLILAPWLWRTSIRRSLPVFILVGVLILVVFGAEMQARLQAAATDNSRQELAYMAQNIIKAFPLGVGENNFDQVMSDKYAHPNWVGHTLFPVHNKYLMVWSELGIQGLAAFVILLLSVVWQAARYMFRRGLRPELTVLPASFLAALAGNAFHMNYEGYSYRSDLQFVWILFPLILAVNFLIEQSMTENGEQGSSTALDESAER